MRGGRLPAGAAEASDLRLDFQAINFVLQRTRSFAVSGIITLSLFRVEILG